MLNIGVIGVGNMGYSIIKGIVSTGNGDNITVIDIDQEKVNNIAKEFNVFPTADKRELMKKSDIIILAIKPFYMVGLLEDIKEYIEDRHILVSIAAGVSIKDISSIVGYDKKIVRLMPNTPAQIQEGMTAMSFNENIEEADKRSIQYILDSIGKSTEIKEDLMHAYTGISGSLPAYVYMFIEAVADGGVLEGIPRDKCYEIIAQTVKGSAEMVLQTKKHPAQLKDEVCSPAGTTIEAVKILEEKGFRSALIEAVQACSEKSKIMSN